MCTLCVKRAMEAMLFKRDVIKLLVNVPKSFYTLIQTLKKS